MHAAEDDVVGRRVLGDLARQLERVAGVVGEPDHLVALVVVAEDDEAVAERGARGGDAQLHLLVRQTEIGVGQRLPLVQALLLDLVQHGQKRSGHGPALASRVRACEIFRNLRTRKNQALRPGSSRRLSTWSMLIISKIAGFRLPVSGLQLPVACRLPVAT